MKILRLRSLFFLMLTILCGSFLNAQTVTGTITAFGEGPLPGASVLVKGTVNGASTDFDGTYTLSDVSSESILLVSYLGFVTKEVPVDGKSVINVTLEEDRATLDEVVVIGYGSQKRSDITTAISTVSSDDIKEIPAADIAQTLQGRAAGVNVISGGSPGEKTTITIRGLSTFGDGDPLYVIDGVFTTSLNNIDPASIKKIDILKDAAASAIYGSRGSNGVVIITTNKGQIGKTTFKLGTYGGSQNSNKRFDILNTAQYVQYIKEIDAQADGGGTFIGVVNGNPDFEGNGVETDWQEELFRRGEMSNVNFNASGGTENTTFSFGASSFRQEGIYIDTRFRRHTFNANSEFNLSEDFRVGQTLTLGFTNRIAPQLSDGREPLFNVLASAPYTPVRNPDGTFSGSTAADNNNSRNQIRVQNSDDNLTRITSLIGSLYGEYDLFDGLTFRSQFGLDTFNRSQDNILRAYDEGGQFFKVDTNISKTRARRLESIFTNSLTYKKTFGEGHNFDVTLVSERTDLKIETLQAASTNLVTSEVNELVASGSATSSQTLERILVSYLGRINYNYKGKYLLSASMRRDKSSIFAPGEQTGYFPAVSVGWVPTKESFLENDILTNLKIRASYGETGNNKIPIFSGVSTLGTVFNYPIDGNLALGTAPIGATNLDLTWEKSIRQNYGFEAAFLNNKFTLGFDYYTNDNIDLLVQEPAAPSVGVSDGFISRNAADVNTSGYEITIGHNDWVGDFKWNLWANVTTTDSEVNNIGNTDQILQAPFTPLQTNLSRIAVGEPLYHFYGLIYDGVYSTNQEIIDDLGADNLNTSGSNAVYQVQEGDARYVDVDGDGDITDADRVVIGDPNPDFTYTLSLKAEYKGFDASLLITGVEGVDAFNGNIFNLESQETVLNAGTQVLRRWQQPGDITDVPRFRFGQNSNNAVSTRYIEDASYTRLRNVTFGYTFSQDTFKGVLKGVISKVRLYVQSQNLLTITDYSGLDPEIEGFYDASGLLKGLNIDRGRMPQPTTFLTGIQIEF